MNPDRKGLLSTAMRLCMMRGLRERARRVATCRFFTGTFFDWTFTLMFTCGQEGVFQPGYVSRVWAGLIYCLLFMFVSRLRHCSSSSLVAYGLGHTMMRPKTEKQVGRKNRRGLTIGVDLILAAGNFIQSCRPHLPGQWLDHGPQSGGIDDCLVAEVMPWPGVVCPFSLMSQRTHVVKRRAQHQLDVFFGHRVDRVLRCPCGATHCDEQFPAGPCGWHAATAVPRMFARTAPCVSKDILVGTWETDTTPLVRPN